MQTTRSGNAESGRFAFDTTLVLFFLAVDYGQSTDLFGIESVLSLVTLSMLVVLPYFLPYIGERPAFRNWLLGRAVIAIFAMGSGLMLRETIGTVLPDIFRFVPMTLLVAAAFFSCFVQFHGILRFRLAR